MPETLTVILSILGNATISGLIVLYYQNKQRCSQNMHQDAKVILAIILEILEDLAILEEACTFNGIYCPLIEHRAPNLSSEDGNKAGEMSYAQRGHQFREVGHRILRNCKKIVFLTPTENLPKTSSECKKLISFLCNKTNPDGKTHLDLMIHYLTRIMTEGINEKTDKEVKEIRKFALKLRGFYAIIEQETENELPSLHYEK